MPLICRLAPAFAQLRDSRRRGALLSMTTSVRTAATLTWLCAAALAGSASAADFYVDPILGSPSGNGSAASPWRTLEDVIEADLIETQEWASYPYQEGTGLVPVNAGAPVQAGDTIWLRTGYHGVAVIRDAYNAAPITIAAQPGHTPRLGRLELRSVQHWVVRGLSISPFHANPAATGSTIVGIDGHGFSGPTWDVTLEDCEVFTVADSASWGASEWISVARSGIGVGGHRVTVRGNRVRNVRFGISVGGDGALISRNLIDGFSADGLRGLGDDGVFEYNRGPEQHRHRGVRETPTTTTGSRAGRSVRAASWARARCATSCCAATCS